MQNRANMRPARVEHPFEMLHQCVLLRFYEVCELINDYMGD